MTTWNKGKRVGQKKAFKLEDFYLNISGVLEYALKLKINLSN